MASVAELKKSFFSESDTVDAAESFNLGVVGSSEFGVGLSTKFHYGPSRRDEMSAVETIMAGEV